ncbi:MAG: hypothetical protein ACK5O2_10020 [Microthrixaceae bacterium]
MGRGVPEPAGGSVVAAGGGVVAVPDGGAAAEDTEVDTRRSGWERALALLVAGMSALAASSPISDNSLLTHIATGRLQVASGLPQLNPFLVTSTDFPVPSWWWSWVLGWSERIAGLGAVRFLTAVVAGVLGWLVVRCSRPHDEPLVPAVNPLVQALPAGVVFVLLTPTLNARPGLVGYALLALALVIWRERLSPLLAVPLFAVWVNVHGSWLYGAAVLGILWVAEAIDDHAPHLERFRYGAAAVGGLIVGGLFYPERFRLVLLPTEQLGSATAREAISQYQEWRPASFGQPLVWIFALVAILALYGVLAVRRDGRIRWGSVTAVVMLSAMGASALRLLPIAAISLCGFAAMGISQVSSMRASAVTLRRAVAGLGVVLLALAAVMALLGPHTDLERYPVEEVDWLQERSLVADPEVRLIENDFVGNYLEFRFGAEANAWVDDRPSVQTLLDYVTMRATDPGWQEALERADPDVVLWKREGPFMDALLEDPSWSVALTTEDFRVLCHARIAERCR